MCNLEVIGHLESIGDSKTDEAAPNLVKHVAAAIQGEYMHYCSPNICLIDLLN